MNVTQWWQEWSSNRPVNRRYLREFWPPMLAYVVLVFFVFPVVDVVASPVLKAVLCVAPVIPILFVMRAGVRVIRDSDEFQRRVHLEAIAISAMGVGTAYFALGFLVFAKLVAVPAGLVLVMILPMLSAGYGVSLAFVLRHYR
ncbi:MAG TPA: hypothetical protein VFB32_01460 [Rudaea sp.]|nr:hypothetical protein [Rudaea sp.]